MYKVQANQITLLLASLISWLHYNPGSHREIAHCVLEKGALKGYCINTSGTKLKCHQWTMSVSNPCSMRINLEVKDLLYLLDKHDSLIKQVFQHSFVHATWYFCVWGIRWQHFPKFQEKELLHLKNIWEVWWVGTITTAVFPPTLSLSVGITIGNQSHRQTKWTIFSWHQRGELWMKEIHIPTALSACTYVLYCALWTRGRI